MAYQTYTTEALVCGNRPNYTSDKSFLLFTKEAGMLWASAKSVREERSKQRYALQDFSLIRVSLVRGKTGWRIGSVECEYNAYTKSASREARGAVTSIVRLLRQFVHGEEPHPEVFTDLKEVIGQTAQPDMSRSSFLVDAFTIRLLYKLGYVADKKSYHDILVDENWLSSRSIPPQAYEAVEQAKTASHL